DDSLRIQTLAKEVAEDLWASVSEAAKSGNVDKDTLKAMYSFVHASNNANGIRNMIALARSDVPINVSELDRDPWLLNLENGTLALRTGKLWPHCREDFITKLAPVAFAPDATCPLWEGFLRVIFAGDLELIRYMQRLVGICLTGVTEEHLLPFL